MLCYVLWIYKLVSNNYCSSINNNQMFVIISLNWWVRLGEVPRKSVLNTSLHLSPLSMIISNNNVLWGILIHDKSLEKVYELLSSMDDDTVLNKIILWVEARRIIPRYWLIMKVLHWVKVYELYDRIYGERIWWVEWCLLYGFWWLCFEFFFCESWWSICLFLSMMFWMHIGCCIWKLNYQGVIAKVIVNRQKNLQKIWKKK